jgi:hypothetical protein
VAIIPQLFLLQRTKEIETMRTSFIVCMGGYRFVPSFLSLFCAWLT